MSRTQLAALALAATTLAVSGCGGSSKTSSATTAAATSPATTSTATTATTPEPATTKVKIVTGKPLTRAQLLLKADAICARTNIKIVPVTASNRKEFSRALPQVVTYYTTETNELSQLVPPSAMAHDWGQILNDFHLYGQYTSTVAKYTAANNFSAAAAVIRTAESLHLELLALATRTGLKRCAHIS